MRLVREHTRWIRKLVRDHPRWVGMIVPSLFALAAAATATRAAGSVGHALSHATTRAWLLAVYGILRAGVGLAFALFTVGRAEPRRRARSPVAFLAAAAAIATVFAFSEPGRSTPEGVVIAGEAVSVVACIWLLISVLALGRCFGVLPEARGLVRRGPYRVVRHPVYLGEIGAFVGLGIASPSLKNAGAVAAVIVAQSVRMRLEEGALTEAFPDYAAYAACTPRLLPRWALLRRESAPAAVRLPAKPQPIGDALTATVPEHLLGPSSLSAIAATSTPIASRSS
jgi:protein-S-isoprenylcysteine O-methyltransferase Ste14